jgi:ribonuclease HII
MTKRKGKGQREKDKGERIKEKGRKTGGGSPSSFLLPASPGLTLERRFVSLGYRLVAGIDEAGRGAWAGPVVAAAVILPLDRPDLSKALKGVNDSKKLTARQRENLLPAIERVALAVGVGVVASEDIDRLGIVPATRLAMQQAVARLEPAPEALVIDAVDLTALVKLPQQALFYGDSISLSIAAASIVAKVSRDRMMAALDAHYPGYDLAKHKGYGTRAHQAALAQLGVSDIHRKSYAPIQKLLAGGENATAAVHSG